MASPGNRDGFNGMLDLYGMGKPGHEPMDISFGGVGEMSSVPEADSPTPTRDPVDVGVFGDAFGESLGPMFSGRGPVSDFSWLEEKGDEGPSPDLESLWGEKGEAWKPTEVQRTYSGGFSPGISEDHFRHVLSHLMRKSSTGCGWGEVVSLAKSHLRLASADQTTRASGFLKRLSREHGLLGKVYIREFAFPSTSNTGWNHVIDRHAANGVTWIVPLKKGSRISHKEAFRGLTVASSVPWGEAWGIYSRRASLEGKRVASVTPKDIPAALLRLFASSLPTPEVRRVALEEDKRAGAVNGMAFSDAIRELASHPSVREVVPARDVSVIFAAEMISRLVRMGRISAEDEDRIASLSLPPYAAMRLAAAVAVDNGITRGTYSKPEFSRYVPGTILTAATEKVEDSRLASVSKALSELVKRGTISEGHRSQVMASKSPVKDKIDWVRKLAGIVPRQSLDKTRMAKRGVYSLPKVSRYIRPASEKDLEVKARVEDPRLASIRSSLDELVKRGVVSASRREEVISSPVSTADKIDWVKKLSAVSPKMASDGKKRHLPVYQGKKLTAHVPTARPLRALPHEVAKARRFLARSMNSGLVKADLDSVLSHAFSSVLLEEGKGVLGEYRRKHEGLVGFEYVDASAYASKTGTEGCEEGGRAHRANPIKYVLSMARCGTCLNNVNGVCGKYGKELADKLIVGKGVREHNLRVATSKDHERTAAMFNPSEFDLRDPDSLDSLEISDGPPPSLAEVFFTDARTT